MAFWIDDNIVLEDQLVKLTPMEEKDIPAMVAVAGNAKIWEFYPYNGADPIMMTNILHGLLAEKEKAVRVPFTILYKPGNQLIGSTSLMDIQAAHKKLEIGTTWLTPDYWATAVNPACKLLLLSYCFEKAGCCRVQLKTDENNMRSRQAISKIGGVFEGILRNDMLRSNGTHRNSAYFSIIDTEWPEKKEALVQLVKDKMQDAGMR